MIIRLLRFPILYFYLGASYRTKIYIRLILIFKRKRILVLAKYLSRRLQKKQGVFLSEKAIFDNSIELRHPVGVVIGEGVKLGKNVIIYQNVTFGGARLGDGKANNYPEVGDNSVFFAGSVIVGKVKVGSNCTIGANSVVTQDIPDNCVAVGAPARVIKRN